MLPASSLPHNLEAEMRIKDLAGGRGPRLSPASESQLTRTRLRLVARNKQSKISPSEQSRRFQAGADSERLQVQEHDLVCRWRGVSVFGSSVVNHPIGGFRG